MGIGEQIANAIIEDLCGRSGGDHFFEGCDEEIQEEIRAKWAAIAEAGGDTPSHGAPEPDAPAPEWTTVEEEVIRWIKADSDDEDLAALLRRAVAHGRDGRLRDAVRRYLLTHPDRNRDNAPLRVLRETFEAAEVAQ